MFGSTWLMSTWLKDNTSMQSKWFVCFMCQLSVGCLTCGFQYQNCLRKFYNNKDLNALQYLARAYFEAGRMDDCKNTLVKAIHIAPNNTALWFNMALAQEQYATTILNRKDKSVLAEVRKA